MFATALTFSDSIECNVSKVYVLFEVDIRATNDVLRWILMAILGMLLLSMSLWLLFVGVISLDTMLRRKTLLNLPSRAAGR